MTAKEDIENTESTGDSLCASDWSKLKAWYLDYLRCDSTQKSAMFAFTAGAARDAATAFESAVFEVTGRRIGMPNEKGQP